MPSSAMTWWSWYLRKTLKISMYRSGWCEKRRVRRLPVAWRALKCSFKSVMGGFPGSEVQNESAKHLERAEAGRLALAEDDRRQQLAQLRPSVGQRHQQVEQRRHTIPVAHVLAEAEQLAEPCMQRFVIGGPVF